MTQQKREILLRMYDHVKQEVRDFGGILIDQGGIVQPTAINAAECVHHYGKSFKITKNEAEVIITKTRLAELISIANRSKKNRSVGDKEKVRTKNNRMKLNQLSSLEANLGWDPNKGSIPFRRPRATPANVKLQQEKAAHGTLIHWAGDPCQRGLSKVDQKVIFGREGKGKATLTALASHICNVNCLACRQRYYQKQRGIPKQPPALQ